ncbi:hypothetical protein [uncultured Kriegella sp.]|uniref:hypothetical protein n=1 Tax=uncultured Kriegella sp. TaxID=1798910 RepID=UPI0030DAB913
MNKKFLSENGYAKYLPYGLSLVCTLLIFSLHMSEKMDSMLNENNNRISNGFLTSQIKYHKEFGPFARRPFTTWLIETTSETFGLKLGVAFVPVNFILLFLSGILIYLLSIRLKDKRQQGLFNVVCYFLTFSILFAFFPPVFSYDEPLQYCFILLGLMAFVQKKWLFYVIFFSLALITRETTVLLLPALVVFLPGLTLDSKKGFTIDRLRLYVLIALPVVFYGIFIAIYLWKHQLVDATKTEMISRYSCFLENFENTKNTIESLVSFFVSLGVPLYFSLLFLSQRTPNNFQQQFIFAFLLTALINTPIVFLSSFARESRLFALPLFFLWPMASQLFGKKIKLLFSFKAYSQMLRKWQYLLSFLVLNILNYWFCFQYYKNLGLGENTYFAEYLFLSIYIITTHVLLFQYQKKQAAPLKNI